MIYVLLFGIICEIMGIYEMFSFIKKKINCTETIMGRIREVSIGSELFRQYPIYEYIIKGKKYVKKSRISDTSVSRGMKVKIHYNPNNPDEFFADGDYNIFYIIIIILFILAGLYVIIHYFLYLFN